MKRLLLIIAIVSATVAAMAQGVSINTTGTDANPSAMLDVQSNNKGMLVPRMGTAGRTAIASPAEGLIVYDTDTKTFWYYSQSAWKQIPNTLVGTVPAGAASGDLFGNYPSPSVGKIQNLDVASGVPLNKQILKWHTSKNKWQAANDSLFLPYVVSASSSSILFGIANNTGLPGSCAMYGRSGPTGSGVSLYGNCGVWGDNSNGVGIMGTSSNGTAVLGHANISGTGIYGINSGTSGSAGIFESSNPENTSAALLVNQSGLGKGISISMLNSLSMEVGLNSFVQGSGNGIVSAVNVGIAGSFFNTSSVSQNEVLSVTNVGASSAGKFTTDNQVNSVTALTATTNGMGRGLDVVLTNPVNNSPAIYVSSLGGPGVHSEGFANGVYGKSNSSTAGVGVKGQSYDSDNTGVGVMGVSAGSYGVGVYGFASGNNGIGIKGESNSSASYAIYAKNDGGGLGIKSESNGSGATGISSIATPSGVTFGTGVRGETNGFGDGVRGIGGGAGNGVTGLADPGSSGNGVYGEIAGGTGYAVKGVSNIATRAAIFGTNNAGDGVNGVTTGSGYGVKGTAGTTGAGIYGTTNAASSSGRAAFFEVPSATNNYDAVKVVNAGLAAALNINSTNASNSVTMVRITKSGYGDFIVFEDGVGVNQIRFNDAGKGFFNGGTQTGGADMAEAFDVTDDVESYEPGDVLIISVDKDRTVEKSTGAYSSLVAGVYATKPGVLMTEENIDADLSGKVPMGVVGVIPTKVCLEGGEIKRGDFIVTSSLTGVAMKADSDRLKPGQIIGKALENYSSQGIGKIRVLVNVK